MQDLVINLKFDGPYLKINLRDIGDINVEYTHIFPSSILTSEEYDGFSLELIAKGVEFSSRDINWRGPKKIIQVNAEKTRAKELKELGLITGHYMDQVRWRITKKGDKIEILDDLVEKALGGEVISYRDIRKTGYMTPEDIRNERIVYFDTENFMFQDNEQTNWITLSYSKSGRVIKKEIYTIEPVTSSSYKGYDIKQFDSYQEMIDYFTANVSEFDPLFLVGYNLNYDINALSENQRLHLKNKVNKEATILQPSKEKDKFKVFRQRFGSESLMVIDLYDIARNYLGFLPNQKLETVVQYMFGEIFEKIPYNELARLTKEHRKGNKDAENILLDYATSDVDVLAWMVLEPEKHFSHTQAILPYSFDDLLFVADTFNLDFERLMFSRGNISDYHNQIFFNEIGTYKDSLYRYIPSAIKRENQLYNKFLRKINSIVQKHSVDLEEGVTGQEVGIYFPWADYVWLLLKGNKKFDLKYPLINSLFKYKYSDESNTKLDGYSMLHDSVRQYSLSKILESFFRPMIVDYMKCSEDKKFRNTFYARWRSYPETIDNALGLLEKKAAHIQEAGGRIIKSTSSSQIRQLEITNSELFFSQNKKGVLTIS